MSSKPEEANLRRCPRVCYWRAAFHINRILSAPRMLSGSSSSWPDTDLYHLIYRKNIFGRTSICIEVHITSMHHGSLSSTLSGLTTNFLQWVKGAQVVEPSKYFFGHHLGPILRPWQMRFYSLHGINIGNHVAC